MADELASLRARGRQAEARQHVVEPALHQLHEGLGGRLPAARGLLRVPAQLALADPVVEARLLLLLELQQVHGARPTRAPTMLPRWKWTPLQGSPSGAPAGAFQAQVDAKAARDLDSRSTTRRHGNRRYAEMEPSYAGTLTPSSLRRRPSTSAYGPRCPGGSSSAIASMIASDASAWEMREPSARRVCTRNG